MIKKALAVSLFIVSSVVASNKVPTVAPFSPAPSYAVPSVPQAPRKPARSRFENITPAQLARLIQLQIRSQQLADAIQNAPADN